MVHTRGKTTVLVLYYVLHWAVVTGTTFVFSLIKADELILTHGDGFSVRSLLDCSQLCTRQPQCCGFNFSKHDRICDIIVQQDMMAVSRQGQSGSKLYLDDSCSSLYEDTTTSSLPTTSSVTTSISTPSTTTTSSSSPPSSSSSSSTTTTTTTTATTTTTTKLSTTSQTAISSSTTKSSTTTNPSTTTTPSTTTITKPSTTTTPPTTTKPSTTTPPTTTKPSTTITSTESTVPSSATALICMQSKILVFSSQSVLQFSDSSSLVTGPASVFGVLELFPQVHGNIVAAYSSSDGTTLYIVTDDDTVQSYTMDTYTLLQETSYAEHFGTTIDYSFNAILMTSDSKLYMFGVDDVYEVTSTGKVETHPLDNNGNKNPYKSKNFKDRPTEITAACTVDDDTELFMSSSNVYTFTHSSTLWDNKGTLSSTVASPKTTSTLLSTKELSTTRSTMTTTTTKSSTTTTKPTTTTTKPSTPPTSTTTTPSTTTTKPSTTTTKPSTTTSPSTTTTILPSTTTLKPSTTTTTLTTTKPSTTITSTESTVPSSASAIVCIQSKIIVFSSQSVLQFADLSSLVTGPASMFAILDLFPQVHGNVVAAYSSSDGTSLYIVTDDDTVQSYTMDTYTFLQESSYAEHFGTTIDYSFNAIIMTSDSKLYMFGVDDVYEVTSKGKVETHPLDNNGNKNPYKSKNFKDRPTEITAACTVDDDTELFMSSSDVYTFMHSSTLWDNKGTLSSSAVATPQITSPSSTTTQHPTTTTTPSTTTTTTTPTPTTTPPTTKPSTTITSTKSTVPSSASAIVCLQSKILVFSSQSVLQFADSSSLVTGPASVFGVLDLFTQVHGNIVAAYSSSDGTTLYIVTDDDTVQSYTMDTYTFLQEASYAEHFGTTIAYTFNAILMTSDSKLYMFGFDDVYEVTSKGKVETHPLDNNGNKNPYKSKNFKDRPTEITAACTVDDDTELFMSNSDVYAFTHSSTLWDNKGTLSS